MKNLLIICSLCICISTTYAQCSLENNSNGFSTSIRNGTKSSYLNTYIALELIRLEKLFNVKVDLCFQSGTNAFATPVCKNNNYDGTISLGIDLMEKQYKKGTGKWLIAAIMAHEIAHILQFKNQMKFENTVHQEIHADMLSGWFLGKLIEDYKGSYDFSEGAKVAYNKMEDRIQQASEIQQNLRLFFGGMGDNNYFSIQHHGNFTTRAMAMHKGMYSYTGWSLRDWKRVFFEFGQKDALKIIDDYNH
jgi:hypothetical protein